MYASYFEKDQATLGPAAIGHTHDWEHVMVWINDNQVKYVSVSQHTGYKVAPASEIRFDGTHPKIVYHKDGISSHCFRFANGNDEPPENATGNWFYPRLVGWNGYPAGYRDKLMQRRLRLRHLQDRRRRLPVGSRLLEPGRNPLRPVRLTVGPPRSATVRRKAPAGSCLRGLSFRGRGGRLRPSHRSLQAVRTSSAAACTPGAAAR